MDGYVVIGSAFAKARTYDRETELALPSISMPYMAVTKNSEDFTLDFHPRAAGASNRAFL